MYTIVNKKRHATFVYVRRTPHVGISTVGGHWTPHARYGWVSLAFAEFIP
jgi:hypothetical protein